MIANESEILLDDCRELMTSRLRSSISRMMGNLENVLFERAARDDCESEGAYYIDAVRELRLKKREIQVRFENRLSMIFVEIVRQLISSDKGGSEEGPISPEHAVEDYNHIDQISILHEPVENTRQECRSALLTLDNHIKYLLESSKVNEYINPMQPENVYNAFWDSCDDLRCGTEIRLIMLQMFERQVAMDLVSIYDDINVLLEFFLKDHLPNSTSDSKPEYCHQQQGREYGNQLLVKCWAQNHIMERVAGQELPELIESFLMEHWSELLADVFQKYSMESLEWERGIQIVDELIECSTLTQDKQSRLHQIWQFPGLIYRLKAGMKIISLPLNIQARFISELKVLHSQLTEQGTGAKNN